MSKSIARVDDSTRPRITAEQAAIAEDLYISDEADSALARLRIDQQKALRMLTEGISVAGVAREMNMSRNNIYYWLQHDPAFVSAMRAWRRRTQREARDHLLHVSAQAVRVIRDAVAKGNVSAALAVLRGQGVLEVKSSRKAMARLRGPRGNVLLEHEHGRTTVSMQASPQIPDAAKPALIAPPPALPDGGLVETEVPPSELSHDELRAVQCCAKEPRRQEDK